jgi:hypothetical protein
MNIAILNRYSNTNSIKIEIINYIENLIEKGTYENINYIDIVKLLKGLSIMNRMHTRD